MIDNYAKWLEAKETIRERKRNLHSEEFIIKELELVIKNHEIGLINNKELDLVDKELIEKRIKTEQNNLETHKQTLNNIKNDINKLMEILKGDCLDKQSQTLINTNTHFGLNRFLEKNNK